MERVDAPSEGVVGLVMTRISCLLILLAACGGEPERQAQETPPTPESDLQPMAPVRVAVHEWGLIEVRGQERQLRTRGSTSSGAQVSAVVPSPSMETMRPIPSIMVEPAEIRAPVLYAHLPEGVQSARFDLTVRPIGGRVMEHYPGDGALMAGEVLSWEGIEARRGACTDAPHYPSENEPGCRTEDQYCEAQHGATWETDDGACLHYGDRQWDHFFYRGTLGNAPLPIELEDRADAWVVKVTSGSPLPGNVYRVSRRATQQATHVSIGAAPATGAELVLETPGEGDPTGLHAMPMIRSDLQAQGLTADEADAFMNAWTEPLLGRRSGDEDGDGVEMLLYWMPAAAMAEHFVLEGSDNVDLTRVVLVQIVR